MTSYVFKYLQEKFSDAAVRAAGSAMFCSQKDFTHISLVRASILLASIALLIVLCVSSLSLSSFHQLSNSL